MHQFLNWLARSPIQTVLHSIHPELLLRQVVAFRDSVGTKQEPIPWLKVFLEKFELCVGKCSYRKSSVSQQPRSLVLASQYRVWMAGLRQPEMAARRIENSIDHREIHVVVILKVTVQFLYNFVGRHDLIARRIGDKSLDQRIAHRCCLQGLT